VGSRPGLECQSLVRARANQSWSRNIHRDSLQPTQRVLLNSDDSIHQQHGLKVDSLLHWHKKCFGTARQDCVTLPLLDRMA
jgi:hypothetical protein